MKTRIAVVTGTRAEYGLLAPLIGALRAEESFEPVILVTGMHLSPEFGLSYREIEADGFPIAEKIEILLSSDTTVGIGKSMGLAMMGFAEAFARQNPDLVLLLGDRFETFAAAAAAAVSGVPIVHLHGGELSLGSIDDAFRHCITKLSHLHFTATEEYRRRVIQLGEAPETVHAVGSIGVESLKKMRLRGRTDLEDELKVRFGSRNVLVTFHPVTTARGSSAEQMRELLAALDSLDACLALFTNANADAEGREINRAIEEYTRTHAGRAAVFNDLGRVRYLSIMKLCDAVIGNSSSGIIEAPTLGVPTVNIGERQQGRVRAPSVIDCQPDRQSIGRAIEKALSADFRAFARSVKNPYDGGESVAAIVSVLKASHSISVRKSFYSLPVEV